MGYRDTALEIYGDKCEVCGYGITEVHHISYQEHQELEDYMRYLSKYGNDITDLLEEAERKGYLRWNGHQLSKDDRSINLAVLCPNHHSMIHKLNSGMKILNILPKRK